MAEHDLPGDARLPDLSVSQPADLGRLGEYQLLERLGAGGMGVVYKALHTELDRVVAVKVLPAGRLADEEAIARFKREIKAVGRLDHPNIVRAYDARRIGQTHFLVMEFVEGLDLAELVRRRGPLGVADACELVRQAAVGLQHAHEHGLVHRDIKPSNLMLSIPSSARRREFVGEGPQPSPLTGQQDASSGSSTTAPVVKILDLGLARIHAGLTSDAMTVTGQVMGTPDYMAPEQASDSHAVDIRADLYSLGCTLYKLLTGWAPFEGPNYRTVFDKLTAHVRQPITPPSLVRGDVPPRLETILGRLLAKDPAQRFQTPGELAEALAPLAAGSDLRALAAEAERLGVAPAPLPPPAMAARAKLAQRSWTRPKPQTVLIGAVILAALGLVVWAFQGLWRARPGDRPASAGGRDVANHPAPAPKPAGRIVISWGPEDNGKPQLWLLRPEGGKPVAITADPTAYHIHPKFSPDGRRIAFVRGKPLVIANAVWVCNADGSGARQLVAASSVAERLMSPVWISDSQIVYAVARGRELRIGRQPRMELRQVDLEKGDQAEVLALEGLLPGRTGLVTDVSPDGRFFVAALQQFSLWATADIYLIDRQGLRAQQLWEDPSGDHKDARPLWSPDGKTIAWHHSFAAGTSAKVNYCGVGLARLGTDGKWSVRFQPDQQGFVTPLAWSPDGRCLLCARLDPQTSRSKLFLMDDQFRTTGELLALDSPGWQPDKRDFGRLADWK